MGRSGYERWSGQGVQLGGGARPRRPARLRARSVLLSHEVHFVVIGGFAALLYGDPGVTVDVDITPSRARENRERLASALEELGAKLRLPRLEDPLEVKLDPEYLDRFTTLTLRTTYGDLDIAFAPDAPGRRSFSYEELAARAVVIDIGIPIPVAGLDDVIGSKEAAGRVQDLEDLTRLYQVRDELRHDGPDDLEWQR